jgi:hypothetical protein
MRVFIKNKAPPGHFLSLDEVLSHPGVYSPVGESGCEGERLITLSPGATLWTDGGRFEAVDEDLWSEVPFRRVKTGRLVVLFGQ